MSCCNLDPDELEILVQGIKKSKSLLSVHLSGNWIKPETQQMILSKLVREKPAKPKLLNLVSPYKFTLKNIESKTKTFPESENSHDSLDK